MKKQMIICDSCEKPIVGKGFAFHGNVFVIDKGEMQGGIIGNNFPSGGRPEVQQSAEDRVETIMDEFYAPNQHDKRLISHLVSNVGELVRESHYCECCTVRMFKINTVGVR